MKEAERFKSFTSSKGFTNENASGALALLGLVIILVMCILHKLFGWF